jgi:hypothetical protein
VGREACILFPILNASLKTISSLTLDAPLGLLTASHFIPELFDTFSGTRKYFYFGHFLRSFRRSSPPCFVYLAITLVVFGHSLAPLPETL